VDILGLVKPECIAVELCNERLSVVEKSAQYGANKLLPVPFKALPPKNITESLLISFQRVIYGIAVLLKAKPGAEFELALNVGKKLNVPVEPIDMEFSTILHKIKMMWPVHLLTLSFSTLINRNQPPKELGGRHGLLKLAVDASKTGQELAEDKLDILKDYVFGSNGELYLSLNDVLLDDRNKYMASRLRELKYKSIVGIVGEKHIDGITKHLNDRVKDEEKYRQRLSKNSMMTWMKFIGIMSIGGYGSFSFLRFGYRRIPYFLYGTGGLFTFSLFKLFKEYRTIKHIFKNEEIKKVEDFQLVNLQARTELISPQG
jgi:pheromone shutdown protein TraB